MSPESLQNQPSTAPASLPDISSHASASGQPAIAQQPEATRNLSSDAASLAQQVSAQAKALVEQYQQDPYRLSGALQQLKAKYLADQFNISAKTADE